MDKKNLFPIGEVSKLFHISVSSLRHYENIGLLTPAYISPDSGYRYYGTEQFEVLNTIRYLRALDMPLSEIEDFLKNKDIDRIAEKLRQQKQTVLKKQQELKRIEQRIDHRLNWLTDAEKTPLNTVSLIQLSPARIVWVDDPLKIDGSADMEAPREASEMIHTVKAAENAGFGGFLVHSISTSDKVLRYGKFNQIEYSEHPTVVQRGDERTINIYAAVPDVA